MYILEQNWKFIFWALIDICVSTIKEGSIHLVFIYVSDSLWLNNRFPIYSLVADEKLFKKDKYDGFQFVLHFYWAQSSTKLTLLLDYVILLNSHHSRIFIYPSWWNFYILVWKKKIIIIIWTICENCSEVKINCDEYVQN